MSDAIKECGRCHGEKMIWVNLKDHGGHQPHGCGVDHIIGCPMCDAKGFVDKSDRDRYYRSMGCRTTI